MKNKVTIGILVGLIVVVGGAILFGDNNDDVGIGNGGPVVEAPAFSLKDYDGNTVNSTDFAGKIMVVNSWAVWCPFCKNELPDFAELQEFFGDEIAVIAIDRAESLEKAKGFTDSIGVTEKFTFLLDPEDTFYRDIGGFSMPETIFVDVEGNIRLHKRGPMDFEEMKEVVLEIQGTE